MYIDILFYLFSSILIVSAVGVVACRNPIYGLMSLIVCFFNAAGLFLLAGAEFLAFLLIMIQIGAIVVLFIFVLMTINLGDLNYRKLGVSAKIALAILLGEFSTLLIFKGNAQIGDGTSLAKISENYDKTDNVQALGDVMFTTFAYPFILLGFILLVAMLGSILLVLGKRKLRKKQDIYQQIHRKREESVELKKVRSGSGVNF